MHFNRSRFVIQSPLSVICAYLLTPRRPSHHLKLLYRNFSFFFRPIALRTRRALRQVTIHHPVPLVSDMCVSFNTPKAISSLKASLSQFLFFSFLLIALRTRHALQPITIHHPVPLVSDMCVSFNTPKAVSSQFLFFFFTYSSSNTPRTSTNHDSSSRPPCQ